MSQSYPKLKTQSRRKDRSITSVFSPDGIHWQPAVVSANSVVWTDQVSLGKSPNGWKNQIAAGNSATSPLDGYKQVHGNAGLSYSHQGSKPGLMDAKVCGGDNLNAGSEVNYPVTVATSEALYKAASSLLGSYISATNTWRGGNFLAEFAETVHMLAHPLKSIYNRTWSLTRSVGGLKKVYRQDPVRYGRLLGGTWLAYAFGIKPLLDDVHDANQAVIALRDSLGAFDTLPIHGKGLSESFQHIFINAGVPSCPYGRFNEDRIQKSEVKYYGRIRAAPMGFPQVATDFGVGLTDILPAVWEAIPWSFLVDYFVNVGEVLDSAKLAFADLAWLNQGIQNTTESRSSGAFPDTQSAGLNGYSVSVGGGQAVSKRRWKHRTAVGSIPYPGWNFRIPGISSTKWCNVTALVAQIAGSRPLK